MILEARSYVPTLAIRPSEMIGLEQLPGVTKERITPCILLAPWSSSKTLDKAVERVEKAFPERTYFLDIDRDYKCSYKNQENQPQKQLLALLNPENAFARWVDFVKRHERAWPCVQTRGQNQEEIRGQIEAMQKLGRPYCMRIVRERFPSNIDEIVDAFVATGTADFAVILEGGWTSDPLSIENWFENTLRDNLHEIDANIPVILSCTSMPRDFSAYSGTVKVPMHNRELVGSMSRKFNHRFLVYGDWGSTRPRETPSHARKPFDRIDYPTKDAWYIVRNKEKEWNFKSAAKELVGNENVWNGNLEIWGEDMIKRTCINEDMGIKSPQRNVAARVNIHLHLQAFHDNPDLEAMDFDEDWQD